MDHIITKNGSRLFFRRGLDSRLSVESTSEFRFLAHGVAQEELYLSTQHPGQSNKIAWTGKSVTRIGVLQTVRRNSEAYCAEKSERGGLRFANPPYKPKDVRLVPHSPLQQDRQWVLQLS